MKRNPVFAIPFAVIAAILFLLLAAVCPAAGPGLTPGKIDEVVAKIMKEKNIPGLSLAISMPGRTIERSYGIANMEYNIPVEKDTVFQIGSVTKTFTAIGILILQQEGKLSVTDRITKYFPQYPQWHDITLKHLLQHASGIREMTETEPFKSNQMRDWSPREVIARMADEPLDFEPGQNAAYSNIGCIILGVVIEKVTGVSYNDFLNDRILKPLGMTHTMFGSTSAIIPKRASGYVFAGKLMNAPFASLVLPHASGGMTSTASDLVRLTKVFTAKALLTEKSVREMFAPARLNNGTEFVLPGPTINMTFGYSLDSVRGRKAVIPAKTGGISGFNTYFAYFPESQTMVALTANLDNSLGNLVIITDALFGLKDR
jgi:CubicO group peptidase (beta-lactamase class C family)